MADNFLSNIKKLFLGESDCTAITFQDLQKYPIDVWDMLPNSIEIKKVFDEIGILMFITKIPKNKSFGSHLHNCPEWCFVVEGWLFDKKTRQQKISGEVIKYSEGLPHEPSAKEDTLLCVCFKESEFK